jgi:hypothetical protein
MKKRECFEKFIIIDYFHNAVIFLIKIELLSANEDEK